MIRPATPPSDHEGFAWVPRVADSHWRTVAGKRCRYTVNHHGCGRPSVAELLRGYGAKENRRWWAYCEEHLYGRWIEGGQVMQWVLRPIGDLS